MVPLYMNRSINELIKGLAAFTYKKMKSRDIKGENEYE